MSDDKGCPLLSDYSALHHVPSAPCRCQPWAILQALTCGPWSCLKGPEQQDGRPAKHPWMAAEKLRGSLTHACPPDSLVGAYL